MALPINIENLINGKSVESERLEFKKGWNPQKVIRTMCAFANDLHNWGGGYIVIGIDEKDGDPVLPPVGLNKSNLNTIQKEIVKLAHEIQPTYIPIVQPYVLEDKHIVIIWCPAGDTRMYTAPEKFGEKSQRKPYVRVSSTTIEAKGETLRQLLELTAKVPFDDRVNQEATIEDLDLGLIQAYLRQVKSELYEESFRMSIADLARAMQIARGPKEYFLPINVGLLFFNWNPEKFFPYSWIEVVLFKDDFGTEFEESYLKGPLHHQLKEALAFIRSTTIREKVVKVRGRAEADRFYNFSYEAIEEALANAVYHKGYDKREPIEVRIYPDKITISSFPGPVPPISEETLKNNRYIQPKEYRNRRIGDFLKELDLTEGRGTGFPTIYKEMEKNGSPKPIFETDTDRIYFLTILPIHERYKESKKPTDKASIKTATKVLTKRQQKAIDYVRKNGSISSKIYQELTDISKRTATNDLRMLVDAQLLKQSGISRSIVYLLAD